MTVTVGELATRSRLLVENQFWRHRKSWSAPPAHTQLIPAWERPVLPPDPALLAEADAYLRGEYQRLGLAYQESKPDWHRDPQTGRVAPRQFALDLDLLDLPRLGNIRHIWEKNRHQHLTVLALAYALTKDERYAGEVWAQLTSWAQENPFPIGINWASSLEVGYRLLAWVWIEKLLRGSAVHPMLFGPSGSLWPLVYWHQWLIEQHHAVGASADHHLVGEMSALFCAGHAWPVYGESADWRDLARQQLENASARQLYPTGMDREMAFGYHRLTLEFLLLALVAEPEKFSPSHYHRVQKMVEAVARLTDYGQNAPRYGDDDDSRAVQFQALGAHRTNWLCQVGHNLLGANIPLPRGGNILPVVLLGATTPVLAAWPELEMSLAIADAGLYRLTSHRDTPQEIFVLADAGPHGFGANATHAHADALAFTLSVGGRPVLVDPGTFEYFGPDNWRRYFRGTRAHNTIVVDGRDQSEQDGPFGWKHQARATVHRWVVAADGATLTASHDGYARQGVTHARRWELRDRTLTIVDELDGRKTHDIELRFHCAPECHAERMLNSTVQVTREGARVWLKLPESLTIALVRGADEAGWYSPSYGVKQETFTVVARGQLKLPVALTTTIEIEPVR